MAFATFRMIIPANTWTLVADGATDTEFGIQITDANSVKLALAASSPNTSTEDFIIIGPENDRSFSMELLHGARQRHQDRRCYALIVVGSSLSVRTD